MQGTADGGTGIAVILPTREFLPRLLRNATFMFSSSILAQVLNLARGVILARLLLPEDFGLFGLATVVIGFAAVFADFGAGIFLIYTDKVDQHADTAFWVNLALATLLAAGVAGAAPLIGRLYARTDLAPVLVVLAVDFWLQISSNVHANMLRAKLRFRALGIVNALASIASFIAAVGLAWNGFGVWAFPLSALVGSALRMVLLSRVSGWLPRWRFSHYSLGELAPFSGWYLGQAVLWYFILNMDNLLVGKFLGMTALGLYALAYNYALAPATLVAGTLGDVALPELARLRAHPSRFWVAFYQVSRLLAGTVYPLASALLVAASGLFPVLFGPKWNDAILPFQILVVYGMVRSLWVNPLEALGRFDLMTWLALVTSVVEVFAIYVGLHYGVVGVAWAVLVVVGGAHVGKLYLGSKLRVRLVEGFRNAAAYLVAAGAGMGVALSVHYLCARWVSDRADLLALVSATAVFAVYGTVFRKHALKLVMMLLAKDVRKSGAAFAG